MKWLLPTARSAERIAALFLIAVPTLALADAGISTHKADPAKDPDGMKAKTFYELLDASLGNKFNSVVVVFGGCFTADFSNKLATSTVGTSGKPVAVLAATDSTKPFEFAGGTANGSTFANGVTEGIGQDGATAQDGFDTGKAKTRRNQPEGGQTPTMTTAAGGGGIKPGQGAASYHAILFSGKPTKCSDWQDLDKMYKELRNKGYQAANIDCYFGRGERAGQPGDNTPILSKEDFSAGNSVKQENGDLSKCPSFSDQGQAIKPATHDNLKKALEKLKTIADAGANEQYFLWFADHSTLLAMATPESRPCAGTTLCSVDASAPSELFHVPTDGTMGVEIRTHGVTGAGHTVFANGNVIGQLDPALDGELQFFPAVPFGQIYPGLNSIAVATYGAGFDIADVGISSGEVPIQPAVALPVPAMAQGIAALLAVALALVGASRLHARARRARA